MNGNSFQVFRCDKQDLWIALALLILAIGLRLPYQFSSSFIVDEVYTASYAAERAFRLVNPMYYLLAFSATELFGDAEGVYRFPAFLLGSISIPVVYLVFSPIVGRPGALVASVLIAINGWHLFHSINARFYTGLFLFGGLSAGFYLFTLIRPQKSWFYAHLATAAISISFHATALVLVAACGVVSLLIAIRPKIAGSTPGAVKIARIHLAIGVLLIIAAMPFVVSTLGGWVASGQTWGRTGIGLVLQLTNKIGPAILVAAAFGWILLLRRFTLLGTALAIIIAFPILVFAGIAGVAAVRADYVFYAMPLVFALAGSFCAEPLRQSVPSRWITWGAASILIAASMPSLISHYTTRASYDTQDPIAFVRSELKPGDTIVTMAEGFGFYGVDAPLTTFPASPFDDDSDWKSIFERESRIADRTWIVIPVRRADTVRPLKEVLACAASLQWRRYARRFDYSAYGAEIYLIDWRKSEAKNCVRQPVQSQL